jgi:hypothetical protein
MWTRQDPAVFGGGDPHSAGFYFSCILVEQIQLQSFLFSRYGSRRGGLSYQAYAQYRMDGVSKILELFIERFCDETFGRL